MLLSLTLFASDRPNVLWLTAEDICPNLGCYGDKYAATPNLDKFATTGVRFTQVYGITGVCAPNRSCLITGIYPSRLGSQGMRSLTTLPDSVKCFSQYLRTAGYYCANNAKTDYNFSVPKEAWDECSKTAHYKKRKPGQPFFAVFNHEVSHEGQIRVPEKSYQQNTRRLTPQQRHDPKQAPVPPYHPDTPEVRRDWARYYDNITAMDYQIGDKLAELEQAGLAEDTIVFFFGDNGTGMPGIKKWVWHDSLIVPLIIHFPKKWQHLAPAAAGQSVDRLVSFVDFAPTILSLAGVPLPRHLQGTAFLGAQAGPPRDYVYAVRDRMAERFDCVRVVHDQRFQYHRNFMPHLTWSQFTSYTEEMPTMKVWRQLAGEGKLSGPSARYFEPSKPVEELYDTQADPRTVKNLVGDPLHSATLERLRKECVNWMLKTGDLGLLPEHEMELRAQGTTPYDLAVNREKNPLPDLLNAADLANRPNVANLPKLLALLKNPDPAFRWWAVIGLLNLRSTDETVGAALMKALKDGSPEVRLAAAEAVGSRGNLSAALPVISRELTADVPLVRLYALNVLSRFGEKAKSAIPAIRAAQMKVKGPVADYVNRMVEYLPEQMGQSY